MVAAHTVRRACLLLTVATLDLVILEHSRRGKLISSSPETDAVRPLGSNGAKECCQSRL